MLLVDVLHGTVYTLGMSPNSKEGWGAVQIRALRRHLAMTQGDLADELNVRQQTVSEWETGQYRPRGASEKLLSIVAERATFCYGEEEEQE